MEIQKDIRANIEKIVASHSTDDAIIELSEYLKQNCWNRHLRLALGELYLSKSNFVQAGKYLYFKNALNESEQNALMFFKDSCANSNLRIFQELVKESEIPQGIDVGMSQRLFSLIVAISEQEGSLPTEIVRWIYNYEKLRNVERLKELNHQDGSDSEDD